MSATSKKQRMQSDTKKATKGLYTKLNNFCEQHEKALAILSLVIGAIMSLLLFDMKVSLSGDDCDYILNADAFWHHFKFPGFRGPLYPIILSPFVGIFGINLIILKSLSAIFILLSLWLLYKSFRGIVPSIVLIPTLLLSSMCSFIFFYASLTYSEPLFMLTQSLFIYFFSKYFLRDSTVSYQFKTDWSKYLTLAVFALCMGLTRSIGYAVIGVGMLYLIIKLRWKDLLYFMLASILVFVIFQIFKSLVWPTAGSAYDIQNYLAKDYYNINAGMEDLPGFWERLKINSMVYLSAFLCQMMGIVPETASNLPVLEVWRTLVLYALFLCSFIIVFKKNTALLFVGIYVGVMNFVSFVLLQIVWAQDRLIMIYYPLILLFLLGGLCYLFQSKPLRKLFFIYPLIVLVLFGGTFYISQNRITRNLPVIQENILGNELYGFTPDWENFIKASQWAAKNLDKDAVIVSRKPSMSKVYTGRDFTGVPGALTVPTDTLGALKAKNNETRMVIDISGQAMYSTSIQYVVTSINPMNINGKGTSAVAVYTMPDSLMAQAIQSLTDEKMAYTIDYNSFVSQCKANVSVRVYDIDMMLRYLVDGHIDYLLLAQLRADPTQNTGVYINNVHRFVWFIPYKYPNRFEVIHKVGTSEPCEIVKFIH